MRREPTPNCALRQSPERSPLSIIHGLLERHLSSDFQGALHAVRISEFEMSKHLSTLLLASATWDLGLDSGECGASDSEGRSPTARGRRSSCQAIWTTITWSRTAVRCSNSSTGWRRLSRVNPASNPIRPGASGRPSCRGRLPSPSGPSCCGPCRPASFRVPCRFQAEQASSAEPAHLFGYPGSAAGPWPLPIS